jgi:deoxycytidine triphosphate deaminase
MTLIAGEELRSVKFLQAGNPVVHGSSVDLTIGNIFDDRGVKVKGPYVLEPNEMVQVSSAETFELPNNVTAHVSYKTSLTQRGIWALTVGIVDPGWNCPVSTTLFNFSKIPVAIDEGDVFLRVSFFRHLPVGDDVLRRGPSVSDYSKSVQKAAATVFPKRFLNVDKVADDAGKVAMEHMRTSALTWVALAAGLFTLIQLVLSWGPAAVAWYFNSDQEIVQLQQEVSDLKSQVALLTSNAAGGDGAPSPADPSGPTGLTNDTTSE